MLSRFGIEASQAAQYVIAFVIILVLVALFGLVLRRLTGGRLMLPGQDRGRARQPRLGIVDIYDLDRQRQLILLRRDNVEHLLLIGGPNDVVIETNIVRVAAARLPVPQVENALDRVEPPLDRAPDPARPQVEPTSRPSLEQQIAARLNDFGRTSERSDSNQELTSVGHATATAPARVEPVLKPDAVTVTAAPGPRLGRPEPVTAPRPAPAPPAEPAPRPEARPVPTPLRPVPSPRAVSTPEPVRAPTQRPGPPPAAASPAPPPGPAADARSSDAAVLSDMAKQLEEALKRPGAPGEPPAAAAAPANPRAAEPAEAAVNPMAAAPPAPSAASPSPVQGAVVHNAPARPVEPPRPAPEPVVHQPVRQAAEPVRPEPLRPAPEPPHPATEPLRPAPEAARPEPAKPAPAPVRAEPMRVQAPEPSRVPPQQQPVAPAPRAAPTPPPAAPTPVAAPPAAAPPPAPAPASPDRTVDDPFSVEEIEAEFARLLGRPVDKANNP